MTVLFARPVGAQENFGDRLKGLVYEAEEWSTPRDAWLTDRRADDKWTLWTKEENVWKKRSKGKSLNTPIVKQDRATPEEGAPPLQTRITGIPKGVYKVYMNNTNRPLALSFDGGKSWEPSRPGREEFLGIFPIDDGVFELWVDDRYASSPDNRGPAYYDYIRFEETGPVNPFATEPATFTLPDGSTQISWISNIPTSASEVRCVDSSGAELLFLEEDDSMRNHRVVLRGLTIGKKYTATLRSPLNRAGRAFDKTVAFTAGARPTPPKTVPAKIKLTVTEPTSFGRDRGPVTSGVPFARSALAGPENVVLQNDKGEPVDARFDVIARWDDGSVKWLICDFLATTRPDSPAVYYLVASPDPRPIENKRNVVNAAAARRRIKETLDRLHSEIVLADGTKLTRRDGGDVAADGGVFRAEGDYVKPDGTPFFRWRVLLSFYDNDSVRIRWALCNNLETADHSMIRSASVAVDMPKPDGGIRLTDGKSAAKTVSILQDRVDHARIELDGRVEEVATSDGFVRVGNQVVGVRDFRQTWPKGLAYADDRLRLDILPELPKENYPPKNWTTLTETFMHYYWFRDGCYLFKRGMEIQSEFWILSADAAVANPAACAAWVDRPLFAAAEPSVYCDSGAFPPIRPRRDGVFDVYEKSFEESFANLEAGRRQRNEYGWMNFGDWFGERRWNWGNNEYDLTYVCAVQFARTGNLDVLRRADEMARHYTTVDVNFFPRQPRTRELVYAHSTGHVGGFVQKDDPRLETEKNFVANLRGGADGSGGHCHQPGNFYMACLTGDRRFFEVAEMVCMNQAKYYTPNYDFRIERAAGWALTNAVYAYRFTGNPFYRNAADLYVEAITAKQNPETGCFDLPQDQSECDCPDKKEHRGGKAFAVGVLLHGLARYYETTQKPEAKQCIVRCADWLLDISWNEKKLGFRYKTGCPKFADSGGYSLLVTEGIATAGELTGKPRYIEFLARTLGRELGRTSGSGIGSGKGFSQRFRQTPHTLYYLEKHGCRSLPDVPKP